MTTNVHMSHEVVPDALPYVDQGYEESGVREMINELIEEETKRYKPTKNYLEFMPTPNFSLFETKIMKHEFERISNRQPMELLSMKRYELPQPANNQRADLTAWTESLKNSMSQLEHQAERVANLELLSQYGADAWRNHCDVLQHMFSSQQKKHVELKRQIQEINWDRKTVQKKAGTELKRLEERYQCPNINWIGLVSKNYEIERAIVETENEVDMLKKDIG